MRSSVYYRSLGLAAAVALVFFGLMQAGLILAYDPRGLFHGNAQIVGRQFFGGLGPLTPWMDRHRLLPRRGFFFDRDGNRFFLGYGNSFEREIYGRSWRHPGSVRRLADHIAAKQAFFAERGARYAFLIVPEKGRLYPAAWPGSLAPGPGARPRFVEALQAELDARGCGALLYPLAQLRAAPGRPYRLEDHHTNRGGSGLCARLLLAKLGLPGPYRHEDPAYGLSDVPEDSPQLQAQGPPALKPALGLTGVKPAPLRMAASGDSFLGEYLANPLARDLKALKVFSKDRELIQARAVASWRPDLVVDESFEPFVPWLNLSELEGFDLERPYPAGPAYEADLLSGASPAAPAWDLLRGDLAFGFGHLPKSKGPVFRPLQGPYAEVYLREQGGPCRRLVLSGLLDQGRLPGLELWADGRPLPAQALKSGGDAFRLEADLRTLPAGPGGLRRIKIKHVGWRKAAPPAITGLWLEP